MNVWVSKKGLSPLIAAVLLIVVVVGIGAVVTGIVRNYVTENKQVITEKASDMKCGIEVTINVPTVDDELRICHNDTEVSSEKMVRFTLENAGSATIDDLQVKYFGTSGFEADDTVLTDAGLTLEPGDTQEFFANYTAAPVGTLQQVKIVPRVKVVGRSDKAYCTDAALTFTDFVTTNCARP
jgi:FlaG/FlaF family flagellin (archaellin)